MRLKIVRYGLLMMTLVLLAFTTAHAADVVSFEITHAYSFPGFQLNWTLDNPVADDPDGRFDTLWIALVDCQGGVIGFHADGYSLVDGPMRDSGTTIPLASLQPVTGREVIAELYDTPYGLSPTSWEELYDMVQSYPLLATDTLDMGETYPECPPPEEAEPNPDVPPVFEDDRLNLDAGAPIVMYNADGSFQIYKVGANSVGTIAVYISAAELAALETPAVNTEIARSTDGSIVVYKLSSGEIQVNTAPDSEGKVFVYILSADALTLISNQSYIA